MLKRPPHPTLEFAHLVPAARQKRLSSLPQARNLHYFLNARAALFHVFRGLHRDGRRRVLLPAFHCVSVVEPALRAGMQVSFYRIDRRLDIDDADLLSVASDDVAAVVFINFFGMPAHCERLLTELRARGITAIEDCSHSFLQANPLALAGGRADMSVYSFWKLVPSAVGGGLVSAAPWPSPALAAPTLRDSAVRTKRLLEEAVLALGPESRLAALYARAEAFRVRRFNAGASPKGGDALPTGVDPAFEFDERRASTRFPWLPRHIVSCADLQDIVSARRRNYLAYALRLAQAALPISVLPDLPERVCPWAFPVIVPERSTHDQALRLRGVPVWTFGNVLHPALEAAASPAAIADARYLADNLLCLPVHQGIPQRDADHFAVTVLQHFESGAADAR